MPPVTPLLILTVTASMFFLIFLVVLFIDLLVNKIQELKLKAIIMDNAMIAAQTIAIISTALLLAVALNLVIYLITPYFN
ncbi:hypothetical protein I5393_05650 [Citrobacter freundii]|uniref:hypothetical protein n=1 Tax=Citrobacter freundii TaxID=546 RepID=UPI0019023513|nr:hypothetical protein [Citrobacter freundii]MBJ8767868.1 hypothetical protein [Citrobacter freundii]